MKRFNKILCVVDPEATCEGILRRAASLAETNQAALAVVAVVPDRALAAFRPGQQPAAAAALMDAQAERLEAAVAPWRDGLDIRTRVLVGIPFIEVIREVLRNHHDLVIKAPEDPGWLDQLLGSDDMHLLRKCPAPVWLIKCEAKPFGRVLAAVDVDDSYPPDELIPRRALNRQVLELATSLAFSEFAELHIAHVWEPVGAGSLRGGFVNLPESEVAGYLEEVRRQHGANLDALMAGVAEWVGTEALDYLKPEVHLLEGWARKEIPALAAELEVDLIVMGTVARTGISGLFMGNTAETILGQIDCSVLAVKPPGFRTPVAIDG